jgi:hypothetical protein
MSHFYGTLQGNRGEGTRGGTKASGMTTYCASWEGAVVCRAWHNKTTGKDMITVEKVPWHGAGENKLLYDGLIGKSEEKLKSVM